MNSFSGIGVIKYDAEANQLNDGGYVLSAFCEFPSGRYTTGIRVVRFIDESPDMASFTAGARVSVQGRLQGRSYEAKDGTKKHSLEIIAGHFEPLDMVAPF